MRSAKTQIGWLVSDSDHTFNIHVMGDLTVLCTCKSTG